MKLFDLALPLCLLGLVTRIQAVDFNYFFMSGTVCSTADRLGDGYGCVDSNYCGDVNFESLAGQEVYLIQIGDFNSSSACELVLYTEAFNEGDYAEINASELVLEECVYFANGSPVGSLSFACAE